MKLEQQFTLDRPRAEVWAFFKDIPAIADCLPGAEFLGTKEDGSHTGKMSVKVGPFQASFEGAATAIYDEVNHSVAMTGKGVDKRGASRGKMDMTCTVLDEGGKTRVTVDADVQLSGSIAQFGRTGIIQEIAGILIADFVANVERRLPPPVVAGESPGPAPAAPAPARAKAPVGGTRLLFMALKSWFLGRFRRGA